jgi:hypothetical protein
VGHPTRELVELGESGRRHGLVRLASCQQVGKGACTEHLDSVATPTDNAARRSDHLTGRGNSGALSR